MSLLELEHLTKKYRNGRGIEDITLNIEKGDVFGLLGPNGSGKTTIMKIMVGMCFPDEGDIRVEAASILDEREVAMKGVGSLIEQPALYTYLTATENLKLAARYNQDVDKAQIEELLKKTGLEPYKNEKVKNYSLGMKQRLGLALALLGEPRLVILDEPTNGLDIEGMANIRELIISEAREKGITFIIASHLAHELEQMCNRVAVLKGGRLFGTTTLKEVQESHQTLEAYFLDCVQWERSKA